ncbi:MAG: T9SS type A sorting domain-containing protein [Bacteroidetes bacterium]|nr:T9SS type A sorting domain-containing protein [Bacteroidota bacterium]
MKCTIRFAMFVIITSSVVSGQNFSVTWPLSSNNLPVVQGYATGDSVVRRNLVVRSYTTTATYGVYQKNGPDAAGNWVAETAENPNRYLAFPVAPQEGYSLTVSTISFRMGWSGTTNNMKANIYYAIDSSNNFSSKTLVESNIVLANSDGTLYTYTLNKTIQSGGRFYLLIYPWCTITTTAKSVGLQNVTIVGTATASGAGTILVSQHTVSFGSMNVGKQRIKSVSVSGLNLQPPSGTITAAVSGEFDLALSWGGPFYSTVEIPYTNGALQPTTLLIRFAPSSIGVKSNTITLNGGSAGEVRISLSGTAVPADSVLGIFVATTGNDSWIGSYNYPFASISKAVSVAQPGDTIYIRGGTYPMTSTVVLSKNGTAENRYSLVQYPGDEMRPVLDFSTMSSGYGIQLSGSYWYIRGIDIKGAASNGMRITGHYNIVEFCSFYENRESGLQISTGGSYNRIINCDSYYNVDATQENADGFAPKLDVGTGNYFYGCRAWQNSDDGWDGYLRPADGVVTTIENCWSFRNGYLKNGTLSSGNGNGFKLGGGDNSNADSLRHIMHVRHCLAFDNKAKGFDQNNNRGSMTLYNCSAYRNGGYNYSLPGPLKYGETITIKNSLVLGNYGKIWASAIQQKNSWLAPFTGATISDFVSVDTIGMRGPRKPDGSLPELPFMRLVPTSQFVDAGVEVGLPYVGLAPDIGCFEYGLINNVYSTPANIPTQLILEQNFPNPFNPVTTIRFAVEQPGLTTLRVYDLLGREVAILVNEPINAGVYYSITFDASQLSSGIYFYRLENNGKSIVRKCAVVK